MPQAGGSDPAERLVLHASCVARGGRAVLITGASGRGKSSLALELMSRGAALVADDRTVIWRGDADGAEVGADGGTDDGADALWADAPEAIRGLIEARGVGLLAVPAQGPARIALVVDLDRRETERLPPHRETRLLGTPVPLLHDPATPHFPAVLALYLAGHRHA